MLTFSTFPSLSFRAYLYILAFTLRDQANSRARIPYIPRTRYCFSINGRGKEERLSLALEQAHRPIPFTYFWCTIYPLQIREIEKKNSLKGKKR